MGILAQVRLLSQRNRRGGERSKIRQRKELSKMWFRGKSSTIFVSMSSEAGIVSQMCSTWRRQSVICCGPLPEVSVQAGSHDPWQFSREGCSQGLSATVTVSGRRVLCP